MMYIFPYLDRVGVEFRRYTGPAAEATKPASHLLWKAAQLRLEDVHAGLRRRGRALRPGTWRPLPARQRAQPRWRRSSCSRASGRPHTVPTDQMIRYPEISGGSRYTFSIWAFAEERYAETLREYFQFAKDYYKRTGFRREHAPRRATGSCRTTARCSRTPSTAHVLTIDPVSTGAPGWRDFLDAYNDFCSEHDGKPLFNQSLGLTQPTCARRSATGRQVRGVPQEASIRTSGC